MRVKGFKAQIIAENGYLLNGSKIHTTAAFEIREHAHKAGAQIWKTNKTAGRRPKGLINIVEVNYIEVFADEGCDEKEISGY